MVTIDKEKCTMCGACEDVCVSCVMEKKDGRMQYAYPEFCIRCWQCVAVCPAGAVECDEFPLDEFEPLQKLPSNSHECAVNILKHRRSVRSFSGKEVPQELLEELVSIAVHAPTGTNAQMTHFVVVTDRKLIDRIDDYITKGFLRILQIVDTPLVTGIVGTLLGEAAAGRIEGRKEHMDRISKLEGNRSKQVFRGAPVLIVAHTPPDAPTGKDDSMIALSHLMFAATSAGLGATWLGYLVAAAKLDPHIKKFLSVPLKNTVQAAVIMGYPKYKYKRTVPRKAAGVKWLKPRQGKP